MKTLPETREKLDSDSEYYSDTFTDKDIYASSYSDFDKAKAKEKLFKGGSKNFWEYTKEIEKDQILPRKMGFQGKKEKKGDMFLKSFYIGDTYAGPFSKGIKST